MSLLINVWGKQVPIHTDDKNRMYVFQKDLKLILPEHQYKHIMNKLIGKKGFEVKGSVAIHFETLKPIVSLGQTHGQSN